MRKIADRISNTNERAVLSIGNASLTVGLPNIAGYRSVRIPPCLASLLFSANFFFISISQLRHLGASRLPRTSWRFRSARWTGVERAENGRGERWWMSMGASRCNFPAERYVLRMYDGFRAWNFRRSPLSRTENRRNVRNTLAIYRARRTAVTPRHAECGM